MALSTTGYTGSGAGTTAANGNYVPCAAPNATYNGATQYTNGTDFLAYNTGWSIQSVVSSNGTPLYSAASGSTTTNMPMTGWVAGSGAASAPTFADMSAGGGGTTARRRPPIFF